MDNGFNGMIRFATGGQGYGNKETLSVGTTVTVLGIVSEQLAVSAFGLVETATVA